METLVYELIKNKPWYGDYLTGQLFPKSSRLDVYSSGLNKTERNKLAIEILNIILEIFSLGYSHNNIYANNVYVVDNEVKLVDFSRFQKNETHDITFLQCIDFVNYCSSSELSICTVLGIDSTEAITGLKKIIEDELLKVTLSFQSGDKRHFTRLGRIYSSFSLNNISIDPRITQRDNGKRLNKFQITKQDINTKSILDLGCNAGGMIFELQKFDPGYCKGIEYDIDKVNLAKKISAFEGLYNVEFIQEDIDEIKIDNWNVTEYDVVLCLAIEKHVKNKNKLFDLLGRVTKGMLLFEGNSNMDVNEAIDNLKKVGFKTVQYIGYCDDDALSVNNNRPLIKAIK
ncbi:class I SAM-dependent methyltransferase [Paenibacillus timonensis]|uniref:Methyltransferase domain-containing protein n=1 Tax=Paenibacillus timonensis TaxID=225915 RepID=A0ABW3SC30_9BACL|nr:MULTISPECIES: methyltransferase domain-containing protein [Paenibacillus]MCH1640499.1 class I SAM-dependent methyltransferase [Paenibacillus timonensis]MDU2241232.1 methyltransferase domain-containing protein [Paenibacillus sp.]